MLITDFKSIWLSMRRYLMRPEPQAQLKAEKIREVLRIMYNEALNRHEPFILRYEFIIRDLIEGYDPQAIAEREHYSTKMIYYINDKAMKIFDRMFEEEEGL